MSQQPVTVRQLHAARFTSEMRVPPVIDVGTDPVELGAEPHSLRLHPLLPPTPAWCYVADDRGHRVVNPTLQVRSGAAARVCFENRLGAAELPLTMTEVKGIGADDGEVVVSNFTGPGCPDPSYAYVEGLRRGDGTMLPTAQMPSVLTPHLHGGNTEARSDGWMENMIGPGQRSQFDYGNRQPSTLLWYHDHAAHVTRANVYAGLAGLYVVRDEDDDRILQGLGGDGDHDADDAAPHGHAHVRSPYEIPMLLQDVNLDEDAAGHLTGRLVHKVECGNGPMEFFGPVTMVNRSIWPKVTVQRRRYRVRLLNGSNARTFSLALRDPSGADVPWAEVATVIGTDGGLRGAPFTPTGQLVLMPAERLDLLVDFQVVAHSRLTVVNTAVAPFGGGTVDPFEGEAPYRPGLGEDELGSDPWTQRIRFPEVLRFELAGDHEAGATRPPLPALAASFRRLVHEPEDAEPGERVVAIPDIANLAGHHQHRYIALVEEQLAATDAASCLTLRELSPYDAAGAGTPGTAGMAGMAMPALENRLITITEPDPAHPGQVMAKTWSTAAKLFHDPGTMTPAPGTIEVWKVVNLSPDSHPFHIHLTQFQVLARLRAGDPAEGKVPNPDELDWLDYDDADPVGTAVAIRLDERVEADEADRCWKDVVRIDPGEMALLAVPFGTIDTEHDTIGPDCFLGRYMYHCHILEHEDHDMMRHFWVTPPALTSLMPAHMHH